MNRVLRVEDDTLLNTTLAYHLQGRGMGTESAFCCREAREKLGVLRYDLVILDVNLPDGDGFTLCKQIQQEWKTAVIFLTANDLEKDVLKGYDLGAADYVTKPFTPLELLARVNSHLRRYSKYLTAVSGEEQEKSHVFTIGGLELNEETVEVTVDGEAVKLTPMEFKIVQLLIKNPGRVFSADEIYERIWNEKAVNTDTIMVHVRNIREKIEIDPRNPKYLKVVWGVGYKIDKQ